MLESESSRLVELSSGSEVDGQLSDTTYTLLREEMNEFAEKEIARIEDFYHLTSQEELTNQVKILLAGQIEALRDTGSEEEFAEFERRLTLAAIDELWMQHIDRMAHLREEVAFE